MNNQHITHNNWHAWQYGNNELFGRQTSTDKFNIVFQPSTSKVNSFGEELIIAAKSTIETFPNIRPTIMFSGGADSELVLRTYLSIGVNPRVCIVRYENDYNLYDVSYAITVCSMLDVEFEIIDFNLQKFYENDAERISEIAQIDRPRALVYCKFLEMIEDLPVMGEGDPYWVRLDNDYSRKGNWVYRESETFIGWYKYAMHLNKPSVPQFFKWTPELVLAHTKLSWFKTLVNDGYIGKLGTNSTKLIGYREVYPDMIKRIKKTGFEKIDAIVNEFELFLDKKYSGLRYRQEVDKTLDQLWIEITGSGYAI